MSLKLHHLLCALCSTGVLATQARAQTYTISDLGTLPGGSDTTGANAINSKGDVTGSSGSFAFLSEGSGLVDLGLAPFVAVPVSSQGFAINTANQVAGETFDGVQNATLYTNGVYTNLTPGAEVDGSSGVGINTSGEVVGTMDLFANSTLTSHAFLWQPTKPNGTTGQLVDLNPTTPANSQSQADAINDSGVVAGVVNGVASTYSGGKWTSLVGIAAAGTPSAIDGSGQIVGSVFVSSAVPREAFLYSGGKTTLLGVLPGQGTSMALAINDSGQIVGSSTALGRRVLSTAVIFKTSGPADLNTLIPANSGWTLIAAKGISDAGLIVGVGGFNGQGEHAFLLTPVE